MENPENASNSKATKLSAAAIDKTDAKDTKKPVDESKNKPSTAKEQAKDGKGDASKTDKSNANKDKKPSKAANSKAKKATTKKKVAGIDKQKAKKATASKAVKKIEGLEITTAKGVARFRRAGYVFSESITFIALDLLSKEQIKQLKDEPNLKVKAVHLPDEAVNAD